MIRNLTFVVLLLILLCGCNSNETLPEDSVFSVDFEIPAQAAAGQAFDAKAFITNGSRKEWSISHGVDVFTFEIRNREGQLVEQKGTVVVISLGISSKLVPKKPYSYTDDHSEQFRRLSISKPGHYFITAKANFRIEEKDTQRDISLTSKPKEIIIE
ncbi:hypothetical protein [Cohnella hashimotonis]|uniref:YtkA-like domain-containing protein n=1 Tax=Cohnella hashimotonis TaxID=2826895 RepID=A0ABT6TUX5_9BACL|nr:hypothetical protein [Cohnella hashimotonis]MDI4649734.1 hypothetical protein [Cohnella hashimotonis]